MEPRPPTIPSSGPPDPSPPQRHRATMITVLAFIFLPLVVISIIVQNQTSHDRVAQPIHDTSISQVLTLAEQRQLKSATIQGNQVTVTTTKGTMYRTTKEDGQLVTQFLFDHGVQQITVRSPDELPVWQQIGLDTLRPLIVLALCVLVLVVLARRAGAWEGGDGLAAFSRSRASRFDQKHSTVFFRDVAGVQEAKEDLREVVDLLRYPAHFTRLGARAPRGVLLIGPPGTGKTLIARAVAGEANVNFFSASGSEFVEMYVGVGASRVRDLFATAKKCAPSIVFIDEIDAIGRHRSGAPSAGNDERDQALNQLLVEMDGFSPRDNVIVIAATNRLDMLDQALLRPGRFDRRVLLDHPDLADRLAILRVHAADKPLSPDVSLRHLAQQTSGFSGADLANVMNEAALLAGRHAHELITQHDLEEAILRVAAGPERKSHVVSAAEKRIVAYHEVGHAIVMRLLPGCDSVRKITTVARGTALGLTVAAPEEDRALIRQGELKARLAGLMGGRAAEQLVFEDITTGAAQDIKQATILARHMVCEFGMSPLGNVLMDDAESVSPRLAAQIDQEVAALLDDAYATATRILETHRDKLVSVAEHLIQVETIDGPEFERLLFPRTDPEEMASIAYSI